MKAIPVSIGLIAMWYVILVTEPMFAIFGILATGFILLTY